MKKPKVKSKTGKTTSTSTMRGKGHTVTQHTTSKTGGMHPRHTPRGRSTSTSTMTGTGSKKTAKTPVKRKWSPGRDVACCSAEALGFLLGWDADAVLGLYWQTATHPDEGASIVDVLAAGADGHFDWAPESDCHLPGYQRRSALGALAVGRGLRHGLILGVSLPEPHAVAVTPDGTWWSWGEPFHPGDWPELDVEEAWAVTP